MASYSSKMETNTSASVTEGFPNFYTPPKIYNMSGSGCTIHNEEMVGKRIEK